MQCVHPKVITEMLGHATVNMTLDTYSHVLPDMRKDAAAAQRVAIKRGVIRRRGRQLEIEWRCRGLTSVWGYAWHNGQPTAE